MFILIVVLDFFLLFHKTCHFTIPIENGENRRKRKKKKQLITKIVLRTKT